MKRLVFLFALLAAFVLQGQADAAGISRVALSAATVSGGGTLTGTVYLSSAAGTGGEVVSLSSNTAKADVPSSVTVPKGKTSAKFTVTTDEVTARTTATISAVVAGVTKTAKLTIDPLSLKSITFSPTTITAETTATGTITLNGAAKTGGFVVSLSSNSAYLDVPTSVTVPAGATKVTFSADAADTSANRSVTVTAVASGLTKTTKVTIAPLTFKSFSSSTSVNSGRPISPKITMSGIAPEDGATVTLNSNRPSILPVPATVVVPAGQSTLSIPLTAAFVNTETSVTVTAKFDGVSKQVVIVVKPVVVSAVSVYPTSVTGSLSTTLKVTLSAPAMPAGYTVALVSSNPTLAPVPASIVVPGGQTTASLSVSTGYVSASTPVSITASLNGPGKTASLTVVPVHLSSVTYAPQVTGGIQSSVTVRLVTAAPAGGVEIFFTSSDENLIEFPDSVIVPEGATSATFTYTPGVTMAQPVVTVTASDGEVSKVLSISIRKPKIYSVSLNASITVGGNPTVGTISLTGPAPEGGALVDLVGNNPAVVPTQVLIPEGMTVYNISFNTVPVAVRTVVEISATWDGVTFKRNLTIDPPALRDLAPRPLTLSPGGTSNLSVRLTGPAPAGGYLVNLTSTQTSVATVPSTVTVPAGATQVTFPVSVNVNASSGQTTTIRATVGTKSVDATATVTTLSMTSFTTSQASVIGGSNLTGTITLSGPAPAGGLSVNVYSLDSEVTLPASVVVLAGQSSVTFTIATNFVSANHDLTINADFGVTGLSRDLTLTPLRPTTFTLDTNSIEGGDTATGTVTLNGPAPAAGGRTVEIVFSTSNGAVTVPASLVVTPGSSTATVSIVGVPQAVATSVTVTATFNGGSANASLTVNPPSLESLSLELSEITGGHTLQGTVELTSPAPAGDWVVDLSDNSGVASTAATVTVIAGQTTATFTVQTAPVAVNTPVQVTATQGVVSKSATFTVIPPKLVSISISDVDLEGGFATTTATVNLDGDAPAGGWNITIASSSLALGVPPMVNVQPGTSSRSFTLTTQVVSSDVTATVTASEGEREFSRDVTVRAIKVSGLTLSTSSVTGGTADVIATVAINRQIPVGQTLFVTITDAHGAASAVPMVSVEGGVFSVTFSIATSPVASATMGSFTAEFNGSASASLTVVPPVPASVVLSPDPMIGGVSVVSGTVTLDGPAPEGGASVSLESSNAAVVNVPSSVTVPAGSTSASFSVTSSAVDDATNVTITADYLGAEATDVVAVHPLPLVSVVLSPATLVGGAMNSTATLTALHPAPIGGTEVDLLSSNPAAASVPSTVTIPAGQTSVSFTVTTAVVSSSASATISASTSMMTKSAVLTVNPLQVASVTLSKSSVQGGSEHPTGTVTLNAAPLSDTEVTLGSSNTSAATAPASVTVLAGETSATFTVTTKYQNATVLTTVSATTNGSTKSIVLTVNAIRLTNFVISPASVVGGVANSVGTVTLSTAAAAPVTVALESSDASASVPATVVVPAGQTTATVAVTTVIVSADTSANVTATFNGTTKTDDLTVLQHKITSISLNKSSVTGGSENLTLTVTLNGAAPAGGVTVALTADPSSHATIPATMTIAAGTTSGTVTLTTIRPVAPATVTVTATYNGLTSSTTVNVLGPVVSSVSVSPSPVIGGTSTTGTVTLNVTAPVGGIDVAVEASNSAAQVPSIVNVPEGATSATFTITTSPVISNRSVTITATLNSVAKTASMVVNAPGVASVDVSPSSVVGGNSATTTVTLTGPAPSAGYVVTVTDNNAAATATNITVAAGQTTGTSTVTTVAVATNQTVTVTATANGSSKTDTLVVQAPVISSLVISPNSVRGGNSTTATITISSPAPAGGLTISITDNSSLITTPGSVTVSPGATTVSFTITTSTVSTNQTKVVTATLNSVATQANLTLTKN